MEPYKSITVEFDRKSVSFNAVEEVRIGFSEKVGDMGLLISVK